MKAILISVCSYLFVSVVMTVSANPNRPPRNNYTVTNGDVTCVVMTAGLELVVPYIGNGKNLTTTMAVPSNPYVNGTCGPGMNTLNVYFNGSWTLSFTFTNSSKTTYQMETIELTYAADSKWFPNISPTSVGRKYSSTTQLPDGTNQAPVSGSYQCQGHTNLALNGSITINLYDFRYRAFRPTNATWFVDNSVNPFTTAIAFANSLEPDHTPRYSVFDIQKCTETSPIPDTDTATAVSVGIALAVMIVVVVLLYLVVTKVRGHKYGYE